MIALILATMITILPFNAPEVDWGTLPLEHQMAMIQMLRPDPIPDSPPRQVTSPPSMPSPAAVGDLWFQPLLDIYFQPGDHQWAARVSLCESGWRVDAKNSTSSASGLFQVMEYWWGGHSAYPAFDPFDAEQNVKFAAWLFYQEGPSHWVCK